METHLDISRVYLDAGHSMCSGRLQPSKHLGRPEGRPNIFIAIVPPQQIHPRELARKG